MKEAVKEADDVVLKLAKSSEVQKLADELGDFLGEGEKKNFNRHKDDLCVSKR